MKRDIKKDGKVYSITYDEYGVVDTTECEGRLLTTRNRIVQKILNNADKIFRGDIPPGFERAY